MKVKFFWFRFLLWALDIIRTFQCRYDPNRWTADDERVFQQAKALLRIGR